MRTVVHLVTYVRFPEIVAPEIVPDGGVSKRPRGVGETQTVEPHELRCWKSEIFEHAPPLSLTPMTKPATGLRNPVIAEAGTALQLHRYRAARFHCSELISYLLT